MKNPIVGIVTVYVVIKFAAAAAVLLGSSMLAKKFMSGISKETSECKSGQKQN